MDKNTANHRGHFRKPLVWQTRCGFFLLMHSLHPRRRSSDSIGRLQCTQSHPTPRAAQDRDSLQDPGQHLRISRVTSACRKLTLPQTFQRNGGELYSTEEVSCSSKCASCKAILLTLAFEATRKSPACKTVNQTFKGPFTNIQGMFINQPLFSRVSRPFTILVDLTSQKTMNTKYPNLKLTLTGRVKGRYF